jgi:hypothetical protein
MGACETTPTTQPPPGETKPATSAHIPQPRGRLFPAPHHRPPLAGIKLVRPRPRLPARRCGRSSLTPGPARRHKTAATRKSHIHSPAQPDDRGKVTGLICHALLTARTPMGADMRSGPRFRPPHVRYAPMASRLRRLFRPRTGERSGHGRGRWSGYADRPAALDAVPGRSSLSGSARHLMMGPPQRPFGPAEAAHRAGHQASVSSSITGANLSANWALTEM